MAAIIFPTDFSAVSVSALPWALKMADTLDATVHCLYIVEEPQIYSTLDMGASFEGQAGAIFHRQRVSTTRVGEGVQPGKSSAEIDNGLPGLGSDQLVVVSLVRQSAHALEHS